MKMNVQAKAVLVALEEKAMANGGNNYYKLAVLQGAEAITLSTTKEVFDMQPECFKEYGFAIQIGEYDGRATYRVVNIFPIKSTDTTAPLGAGPEVSGKTK